MNFMIAHPQPSVATASVEGSTRIPYGWFHADYPDIPMWDGFEDLSLLLSASEWHQTFFTGVQVRLLLNLNFATSTSETISSFWNARYYAVLFPVFKQVLPSLTKATVGKGMKNQLFAFQRQIFAITTEAYRASMTGVPDVPAAELATGAGVLAAPSVVDPSTALANSVAKLLDGITQSVTNTSGSRKRGFVGDGSVDGRLAGRTDTGTRVGSTVGGSGMRNHGNRGGFGRGGGFVSGNTGVVPPPSTTGVGLGNSSRKAPQFPSNRWGTKLKPKFIPDSTEAGPGRSGFKRLCVLHSVLTHTSGSGCAATAACRELYGHSRVLTNAELTKCMH